MRITKQLRTGKIGWAALVAALVLCLGVFALAGCGSEPAEEPAAPDAAEQEAGDAAVDPAAAAEALANIDSWQTVGDALAASTGDLAYGFNENYFIGVIDSGESQVRFIAKPDSSISEKLSEIDFNDPDRNQKYAEALGGLELLSAEEISGTKLAQEDLDAYVGKTSEDMIADGFTFSYYSSYGGEETCVTMDNGYYSYEVTFDVSITEADTEDEGASIAGAKVKYIESLGNLSEMALDPDSVA